MTKLKVLFHTLFYPMAIGQYFRRALEQRDDIELKTVGITTGSFIPWKNGMNVLPKYAYQPDIPLPYHFSNPVADYDYVKTLLGDWKPDLIITVDASSHWKNKPSDGYIIHIATDAHCLNYDHQRRTSDVFYNMHERYSVPTDRILPYCYDHTVHYKEYGVEKEYDVAMIGVEYQHRIELAQRLKSEGIKVVFSNGEIFDEYRQLHQKALIGLNWSSLDDLNARAFELPAMGNIPVMNRVTDMNLPRHQYFNYAYLFQCQNDTAHEGKSRFVSNAVEQVKRVLNEKDEALERLDKMREEIKNETYAARIQTILEDAGYGKSTSSDSF